MDAVTGTLIGSLASAFLGGVLTKIVDVRSRRSVKELDLGTALRDDLYKEVTDLRGEIDKKEAECNAWRDRYYEQLAQLAPLRGEVRALQEKIKRLEESDLRRQKSPDPQQ